MRPLDQLIVTNAAGMVKRLHEAQPLLRSAVTRIEVGSLCLNERPGNIGKTYHYDSDTGTSWNSKGLPSPALKESLAWLPEFRKRCNDAGKQLAVNFAPFTVNECGVLADALAECADVLVFNAGCGNVWENNQNKPIPFYCPDLLAESLDQITKVIYPRKVLVKGSPITDKPLLHRSAVAMVKSGVVDGVIAVNTLPGQRARLHGEEVLAFQESEGAEVKHVGGMAGTDLRPYALQTIEELAQYPELSIIACGGINSGPALNEFRKFPIAGFAVGTAFFENGARIFSAILAEAADVE